MFYSKALSDLNSRPAWRNWVGVATILFLWIHGGLTCIELAKQFPFWGSLLGVMVSASMLNILYEIGENYRAAHAADQDLGRALRRIEFLESRCALLEKECERLAEK